MQLRTPTTFLPSRRVPILMSMDRPMLSTVCWHTNNQITTTSKHQHAPKKAYPKRSISSVHPYSSRRVVTEYQALQRSIRGRAFLGSTIMYVLHYQHSNRYLFHKLSQPPQAPQNSGALIHQISLLGVGPRERGTGSK